MVSPGTEVVVTGVGVTVAGAPGKVGSMATVGRGMAGKVGKGNSVETGLVGRVPVGYIPVGSVPVGLGLTLVLPGWVVMVGS
jgi:hypothetical protein